MTLSDLVSAVSDNGALGLSLACCVVLSAVVMHLYRTLEAVRQDHTTYLVMAASRQIESDRKLAEALDGVRDAVRLALSARGPQ